MATESESETIAVDYVLQFKDYQEWKDHTVGIDNVGAAFRILGDKKHYANHTEWRLVERVWKVLA